MSPVSKPTEYSRRRRAIASLDLLVSIPSAALIFAGLASCMMLMLKSKSMDERFYRNVQQVADASIQMAMEIEMANAIAESTSTAIEFCVPDRDGDFLPEQIRYEWKTDGITSPKHLYRRMNSGTDVAVLRDITDFQLQYGYAGVPSIPNRFRSESVLIKKVDSVPSVTYQEYSISSTQHIAVVFRPDTLRVWDLGSLEIMLRSVDPSSAGSLRLRVTDVDVGQRPILATVYADIQISNQDLSSKYRYFEFPLAPVDRLTTNPWIAVVLSTTDENPPVRVQGISALSNFPSNVRMHTSSNGGSSWLSPPNASPRFLAMGYLYGTSDSVSNRRNLASVDILISNLPGIDPTMMSSARLLGQPEVP
ncbi:MAG: hypothetical protein FJ308_11670 [Planctomycetes bacterium]|nr:hypothetical protein [Planctomycetota bacterium]